MVGARTRREPIAVITTSCLQCGTPAARPDATFCRRCGLPYGDAPRADAELPTCPTCYRTVDDDGRTDSLDLPGLRVDLRHHMAEHDRHPVGDDEWLETLREGDKIRWGRWTAPFDTVRRYLVTGLVLWVPLGITIWVLALIVSTLDQTLLLIPQRYRPEAVLGFSIPGLGVVLTFLILLVTGMGPMKTVTVPEK